MADHMEPDMSPEIPIDEDDIHSQLTESASVSCPYCGESIEMSLDPAGGTAQEYVEDCEVCCRPWAVRVIVDGHGQSTVSVSALDDA